MGPWLSDPKVEKPGIAPEEQAGEAFKLAVMKPGRRGTLRREFEKP